MTDSTTKDDRCPHCNHKYWRNTFEVCPNCGRHHSDPVGSPPPPTPQQAAAVAFSQQPPEARMEGLLRRIADDQARTAAATESIKWGVWALCVFFIVVPVVLWLLLSFQ
jgi:hypothetical protein